MQSLSKSLVALVFSILMISAPMVRQQNSAAQARRFTLTIVNASSRQIHRLHMSSSGTANWGPDLLRRSILHPGQPKGLGVSSGEYDVLFIDANDNQCVLKSFPVYNDRSWSITDDWLANHCQR